MSDKRSKICEWGIRPCLHVYMVFYNNVFSLWWQHQHPPEQFRYFQLGGTNMSELWKKTLSAAFSLQAAACCHVRIWGHGHLLFSNQIVCSLSSPIYRESIALFLKMLHPTTILVVYCGFEKHPLSQTTRAFCVLGSVVDPSDRPDHGEPVQPSVDLTGSFYFWPPVEPEMGKSRPIMGPCLTSA